MSNHVRVYEGILNWPLYMQAGGYTCRAPVGEDLPPWGIPEDESMLPEKPCGFFFSPKGGDFTTPGDLIEEIEEHMRTAHGAEV